MFIICYVVHLKLIFFPVPHNLISRKTEQVLDLGRFREEHDLHFANILDRSSEETKIKELTRTMTQMSDRDIVAPLEPMDLNLFISTNPIQFFMILTNVTDGTRSIHHSSGYSYEDDSNIEFIFVFTFENLPNLPVDMTGYTMSFYAQMMSVTVCLFKDYQCGSSEDMDITDDVPAGAHCLYTISPSSHPYCVGEEVEYTTTSKYKTPAVDNDIKSNLYSMRFFNLVYIYTELSDDGSVRTVHNNDDSYEHYRLRFEDPEEKNLVVTSCEVHTGFNLTETDEEMHNIHKAMFDRLHKSVW